ncbi:helix-turn-helix domain-containing protein [Actinomarinicola tropica]|uniref:Helix-turn-helix domain-containing protein n=1 Tax=Actinomarinicola tropica TaxID=2789776 RepID=A0A5Q2RNY2_9ACTN|nr:helix-turn-helix domain-containing protein [Actinomarinicola tropica]QGG95600.1 hypothetical protein GH723_11115 [Actinomarinicola tropica]
MTALPIDDYGMPEEYDDFFTESQHDAMLDRTKWAILVRKAPKAVLRSSHKTLCFVLFTYVVGKSDATCWPSQETLARDSGLSERAVWEILANLEADGWIERTTISRRQSQVITLCWPPYRSAESRTACGTQSRTSCGTDAERRSTSKHLSPEPPASSPEPPSVSPELAASSPEAAADKGEVKDQLKVQNMALNELSERWTSDDFNPAPYPQDTPRGR